MRKHLLAKELAVFLSILFSACLPSFCQPALELVPLGSPSSEVFFEQYVLAPYEEMSSRCYETAQKFDPPINPQGLLAYKKLSVESTAYCLRGITYSGVRVHPGCVAVDPRVIPLGSAMHVSGYGFGIARDTGSAIKGKIIDLWFPARDTCISWGRRTVEVILYK